MRAPAWTATALTLLIAATIHAARLAWPIPVENALFLGVASLTAEPWRLLSSLLIHTLVPHFLFNAITLWMFGAEVERRFGALVFMGVFAAGMLVGHAAQLVVHPIPIHGVSGGVSALAGLLAAADSRDRAPVEVLRRPRYAGYAAALIALFVADRLGWLHVATLNHAVGVAVGVFVERAWGAATHRHALIVLGAAAATGVVIAGAWSYERPWRGLADLSPFDCAIARRPGGDVTRNAWVRVAVVDESESGRAKLISYIDALGTKVMVSKTARRAYRLYPYLGTIWRIEDADGGCLAQVEVTRAGRVIIR